MTSLTLSFADDHLKNESVVFGSALDVNHVGTPSIHDRQARTPIPRRPKVSAPSGAGLRSSSPENDGDRPRERGGHKAEVDPRSISLGGPGKHEHMDHDPKAHSEAQSKPDEIARGLIYGRKAFALGTTDAHGHGDECADKERSKHDSQYPQPHRDALCRRPAV